MGVVSMKKIGAALALLITGFVGGSVLADTAAVSFKNATIFKVMQRVHRDSGADIVWTGERSAPQTFRLPSAAAEEMVPAAARPFSRDAVRVSGVYVLPPALPRMSTGKESAEALGTWLGQTLPMAPSGPGRSLYSPYNNAMLDNAKSAWKQLPVTGATPFMQLTPDQQQAALNALRGAQVNGAMASLDYMMQWMSPGSAE